MKRCYLIHLFLTLLTTFCLLQVSCTNQQQIKSQYKQRIKNMSGPLAQSLNFIEQDRYGEHYELGHKNEMDTGKVGIPSPGQVDIDSLIDITINKTMLTTSQLSHLDANQASEMHTEYDLLRSVIQQLDKISVTSQGYVETYLNLIQKRDDANVASWDTLTYVKQYPQSPTAHAFDKWVHSMEELSKQKSKFLLDINDMYEETDPEFADFVGGAIEKNPRRLREALEIRLQKLIAAANKEQELWLEPLNKVDSNIALELEAFLISGKERAQIHLPCYDDLDKGLIQRRHINALDLSSEDRKKLEVQWQSTIELSKALENYHQGIGKLDDVIEKSKAIMAPEVTSIIDKAVNLYQLLKELDPNGMINDLEPLFTRIRNVTKKSQNTITTLNHLVEQYQSQLKSAKYIVSFISNIAALKDNIRTIKPENLPDILFGTKDILDKISTSSKDNFTDALKMDLNSLKEQIDKELASLKKSTNDTNEPNNTTIENELTVVKDILNETEIKNLEVRLKKIYDLYKNMYSLVSEAKNLVSMIGINQYLPREVGTINCYRVPLDKITDTSIDLLTTPRQTGDSINFRARLYSTGNSDKITNKTEPIDVLEASFEIHEFSWHNRLSPSVVLVRPTKMETREESFAFAPALSWIHHYGVRPEQDNFAANIQRILDMSIGIHATFVNFDPDKEVEIGLGSTLSFWKDRLQFGFGVNLMAPSKDDGRYYFFVGSDLISLLNTIGLGK